MARIRTIKPEIWSNDKVVSVSAFARLLFIGLWNFSDDYGRGRYVVARIKMQVLPGDNVDVAKLLNELRRAELISVYEVDGKEYFQITGWEEHQKVDRKSSGKYPTPPRARELKRGLASPREGSLLDQGSRIKEGSKKEAITTTADVAAREAEIEAGSGDPPAAPVAAVVAQRYIFFGKHIRLNQRHYDEWGQAFSLISLRAELEGLDAWLDSSRANDKQRADWFHF